jgi:FkbM family methyltransferase
MLIESLLHKLSFEMGVAGRKRNAIFKCTDFMLGNLLDPRDKTDSEFGVLSINWEHAPERMLFYFSSQLASYYKNSPLGRFIVSRRGQSNETFVDIGANLGFYSMIAKSHGFRPIAIEPEPMHFDFLKRNTHAVGKVIGCALSDKEARLSLYYEKNNPGATSLFPASTYIPSNETVQVVTFTKLYGNGEFGDGSSIGLIKVDVEGFEENVIEGMKEYLDEGFRPVIWCEVRGSASGRNGGSYARVNRALQMFGYKPYDPLKSLHHDVDLRDYDDRGVFDICFICSDE